MPSGLYRAVIGRILKWFSRTLWYVCVYAGDRQFASRQFRPVRGECRLPPLATACLRLLPLAAVFQAGYLFGAYLFTAYLFAGSCHCHWLPVIVALYGRLFMSLSLSFGKALCFNQFRLSIFTLFTLIVPTGWFYWFHSVILLIPLCDPTRWSHCVLSLTSDLTDPALWCRVCGDVDWQLNSMIEVYVWTVW